MFEKYDNIDVNIKNSQDYQANPNTSVDYVQVSLRSALRLLATDTTGKYFSDKNQEFLEESGLNNLLSEFDAYLKPPLSAYTKYDMLLGSPHVKTPLKYRLESHTFLACTKGKIRVKMRPGKGLPIFRDYENYEFLSTVNPWNKDDLVRVKFIDFELIRGDVLFIPPYWWYSCSFGGDPETIIAELTYDVVMNVLAQSKHWLLYYLQQSNIKTKPDKPAIFSVDGGSSEEEPNTPINREIITNAGTYVVNSGDQAN